MERTELRAIFDEDADAYDRARPTYPAALLDDLLAFAGLSPGSRIVEIGPGTGQATRALAAAGMQVTAVELGSALGDRLRTNVRHSPVSVVEAAFENWTPPEQEFEAVVAFTSWHWLDPAVRAAKAYDLLRFGGTLATGTTMHVAGGTEPFFAEVQDCYERFDPSTPPGLRLEAADAIPPDVDEVDESDLFEPAERLRYTQDVAYSTDAYLDLLTTYSGHRALPADQRRGLLDCIRQLVDSRYGGSVTKRYLYELRLARSRPGARTAHVFE